MSRTSLAELYIPLLDADVHLTRDEIETLAHRHLRPTVELAAAMVAQHGGVAGILLAGGASRMPLVAAELLRATGIAPVLVEQPEIVVAGGALRSASPATTVHALAPAASPRPRPLAPSPRHEPPTEPEPPEGPAVKRPIPPGDAGVRAVAIRPDGAMWAYATDSRLRVWDPVAGVAAPMGAVFERRLTGLNGENVVWSPSGAILAVAHHGKGVELINRHIAGSTFVAGHRAPVTALAWSPDGSLLASGSAIGEVVIRRARGGGTLGTFSHSLATAGIARLTWSAEGSHLAAVGVDGGSLVWHNGTLTPLPEAGDIAFWPDGTLFEVTIDGRLRSHDPVSGRIEELLKLGDRKSTSLRVSPDGTCLAALLDDGRGLGALWRWSPVRRLDVVLPLAGARRSSLSWTPDGEFLVTANGGDRHPVGVTGTSRGRWTPRDEVSR